LRFVTLWSGGFFAIAGSCVRGRRRLGEGKSGGNAFASGQRLAGLLNHRSRRGFGSGGCRSPGSLLSLQNHGG
jgi:hypothetical protein